ncbi:MAG: MerR family transcriptional regulator [Solirubrobacterales bacterium]
MQTASVKEGVRIGRAAKAAGTTARTIRYYEEIGLLPASESRAGGAHRLYSDDDIDRVKEILRLKNVLGLSLDELRAVIDDEEARKHLRTRFQSDVSDSERREILEQLQAIVERQLELTRRRRAEIDEIEDDLTTRRRTIQRRLRELA